MADIELVIKIPEESFGIDINDKFQDFFYRLKAETQEHLMTNTNLVCGTYELETINMLLEAFKNSILLPEGHGKIVDIGTLLPKGNARMVDISKIDKNKIDFDTPVIGLMVNGECIEMVSLDYLNNLETIIEADKLESGEV